MKQLQQRHASLATAPGRREHARAQTILLVAICFLLGVAVSALVFYATSKPGSSAGSSTVSVAPVQLSPGTEAVLRRLNAPLQIRSYALLDPSTVPAPVVAFAGRVNRLLGAYEQGGNGLVKLSHVDALSKPNIDAAEADGIDAFNQDKGEPCYLGLALALKDRKELMPRLSPDWEPALESDLTHAIGRLIDATRPPPPPVVAARLYTNAAQEVRGLIPDLNAVSLEEGKRILKTAAVKEFTAATKEMQAKLQEAEQRLSQALTNGSEADQQAARKTLQQVQAEQTVRLKEIAARSSAQVEAFQQLKSASP